MKKSDLINKSLESSRRIESIKRAYSKGKPVGYVVEFYHVADFSVDKEGNIYNKILVNRSTTFVPGDSLEDVNDWLNQFDTLQELHEKGVKRSI